MTTNQSSCFKSLLIRSVLACVFFLAMGHSAFAQLTIVEPTPPVKLCCPAPVYVVALQENPYGYDVYMRVGGGSWNEMRYIGFDWMGWYFDATTVTLGVGVHTIYVDDFLGGSDSINVTIDGTIEKTVEIDFKDPYVSSSSQSGPFLSNENAYDRAKWISAKVKGTIVVTCSGGAVINFVFDAPGIGLQNATDQVTLSASSGNDLYLQNYGAANTPVSAPSPNPAQDQGGDWILTTGWKRTFKYTWSIDQANCSASLSLEQQKAW